MIISNRPETFLVQVLTRNFSWGLFNWVAFVFVWFPRPLDWHWSLKTFNTLLLETRLFYSLPFLLEKKIIFHFCRLGVLFPDKQLIPTLSPLFSKPCLFRELSDSFCLYLETQRQAWPGMSVWGGRDAVIQIHRALSAPDTCCLRVLPWTIDGVHTPFVPTVLAPGFPAPFGLGLFQEPRGGGFRATPEALWGVCCRGSVTSDLNTAVTAGWSALTSVSQGSLDNHLQQFYSSF